MRYDLMTPRKKKDGGTFWHRVGAAFSRENGDFALELNSLPLPDENGKVFVLMSEHKSREERQSASHSGGGQSSGGDHRGGGGPAQTPVDSDEIPFSSERR